MPLHCVRSLVGRFDGEPEPATIFDIDLAEHFDSEASAHEAIKTMRDKDYCRDITFSVEAVD
jgi:hypothetical protein